MAANPDVLAYLTEGAKRRGMDVPTVVRAFGHEGLNVFDPNQPDRGGDEGSSFGPYQLHYKGLSKSMPNAGMGDDFTAKTGLDARDPSTWRQQTDFVLDHLAGGGSWSPWMGAAAEGITGRMGLPGGQKPGEQSVAEFRAAPPAAGAPGEVPALGSTYVGTPQATPVTAPVQGAMTPPGWKPAAAPNREQLATEMFKNAAKGFAGAGGFGAQAQAAPVEQMPKASRVDTPEAPMFDPNQIANQRQQLAMAMQKLNSGKLWT